MQISNIDTTNKMADYLKNNNSSIFYKKIDELNKSRHSLMSKSKFNSSSLNISTNARDSSYLYQKKTEDNQDFSLDFNFHLNDSNDSNDSNNSDSNYSNNDNLDNSSQYSFHKLNKSYEGDEESLLNRNHNYGSFVYINKPKGEKIKKPNSLAEYLNNSIYFFKESYKYISNYNSI